MRRLNNLHVFSIALLNWLSPLQVSAQSCKADCSVSVPNAYQLNWTPRYFDTTIVAATVVEVINTDVDTTRVTTIYNEIPAGYTIPTNTNSLGTQTVQVTYLRTGKTLTTEIAFPTQFRINPDRYEWMGTLPTEGTGTETVCSTAAALVPVIVDFWSQDSTFTMPTHTYGPDPGGLLFSTMYSDYNVGNIYTSFFTNEAALQTCQMMRNVVPANMELTARFITDTSTSYEGGSATSAGRQTISSSAVTKTDTQLATQPRTTEMVTSTALSTFVTDGPSGTTTVVSSVEVVVVTVISTPAPNSTSVTRTSSSVATSTQTNIAPQIVSTGWTWLVTLASAYMSFRHDV